MDDIRNMEKGKMNIKDKNGNVHCEEIQSGTIDKGRRDALKKIAYAAPASIMLLTSKRALACSSGDRKLRRPRPRKRCR